jgi:hypothetical protein
MISFLPLVQTLAQDKIHTLKRSINNKIEDLTYILQMAKNSIHVVSITEYLPSYLFMSTFQKRWWFPIADTRQHFIRNYKTIQYQHKQHYDNCIINDFIGELNTHLNEIKSNAIITGDMNINILDNEDENTELYLNTMISNNMYICFYE